MKIKGNKGIIVFTLFCLVSITPAWAKESDTGNDNPTLVSGQDEANQYQNENQEEVKNQGTETQLQESNENAEQEGTMAAGKDESEVAQNVKNMMGTVTSKIDGLKNFGEESGMEEGLKSKVQAVAKNQELAQGSINSAMDMMQKRTSLVKFFFGPDYQAINELSKQREQNELRIQELREYLTQVQNESDESQLQEAITAMTEQNTALQEQINEAEDGFSLFGWLVKFFVNLG